MRENCTSRLSERAEAGRKLHLSRLYSEEAGENQWSKGRDGLRKTGHRQLSFVFADSPDGGGEAGVSDASDGRAYLLHKAKRKTTARAVACTA